MSYYDGEAAGKHIKAGLESVARSLDKIAEAAIIAAEAYAERTESQKTVYTINMGDEGFQWPEGELGGPDS